MHRLALHQLSLRDVAPVDLPGIARGAGVDTVSVFVTPPSPDLDIFPRVLAEDAAAFRAACDDHDVAVHNVEVFSLGPDTVVDDFTANLHPRMLGLTGSPEQVKAASQAYRTYYNAQDSGDDEYYLVDHSTMTYLVFPETGFADFFRRDASAEEMADRVQCFLDAR